jgi:hypothetical protein
MSTRLTTLVLAAFYLLQATWLLHAGMDLLLPKVRAVAAANPDSPCSHSCGCPDEAKESKNCCCAKHAGLQTPKKPASAPSALEAARCKGIDEAMTQAFTQPVVSGFTGIVPPLVVFSRAEVPDLEPILFCSSTPPEKVPIAQA